MKKFTQILGRVVLLVLGFGLTFVAIQVVKQNGLQQKASSPELHEGDVIDLPDLPALTGGSVDLKSLDKPYLLCAIFSVSCPGCTMDSEFWKDLKDECEKKNISFYLISGDSEQNRIKRFVKAYDVETLPILYDPDNRAKPAFKISIVPQYLLLGSDGKLIARWDGVGHAKTKDERAERINEFFKRLPGR